MKLPQQPQNSCQEVTSIKLLLVKLLNSHAKFKTWDPLCYCGERARLCSLLDI
ncbi:CG7166 [Drosophila busckii]|uniref:CG7166 n=1 Tax=Drosophila busckii TaxID=30019 RepID=A0A0M4EN13_DROBS|nr:CG7166 [Drosophila busckii]